jgi:hypothetical protein
MKMKTIYFIVLCAVQLAFISCQDHHFNNSFGFNTAYNQNSNGITIMDVKQSAQFVYLIGTVTANSGELEVILTDGKGVIQYQKVINGDDGNATINEKLTASPGYWKLRYISNQAVGTIDLHLKYEN